MKIDCCLYTGSCPFRHLPESDSPGSLLDRLELEAGVFLPFPPLFYHRPHAGLESFLRNSKDDSKVLLHGPYHPVVEKAGDALPKAGSVLLAPALHHYSLKEPQVNEAVCMAAEADLPVVLFRNLGDPRLAPDWLCLRSQPLEEVADWILNAPPSRLVLSHFFPHELDTLLPVVAKRPDLYVEIGAFSSREGWFSEALSRWGGTQWLYGSGAPLHYSLGNRLAITAAAESTGFALVEFDQNARRCYGFRK